MPMSPVREHTILNISHVIQFCLIVAVLGISIYRMQNSFLITSRYDTIEMVIALRGLIIMAYMIYTEKVQNLKRFSSIKANFILSCTEVVFWAVGTGLPFMNVGKCVAGLGCHLVYVIIGLAAINFQLALLLCWITRKHWQFFKRNGVMPGGSRVIEQQKEEYNLESGSDGRQDSI